MLAPSSVIKSTAKTGMKGSFLKCVIAASVLIFSFFIFTYVASVISVVFGDIVYYVAFALMLIFLFAPLFLGVLRFFRRLLWGESDSPIIIFHFFSSDTLYIRSLRFIGGFVLRYFLCGIVLFLPAIIVDLFTESFFYDLLGINMPAWISNMWVLSVFLTAAAAVLFFFFSLRWYLAPFLYVADEEMDASEALHMSTIISRNTTFEYFTLILSFSPLILASFFVIPTIFTVPYFIATYIVHCRFAVANYNRVCDDLAESRNQSYVMTVE